MVLAAAAEVIDRIRQQVPLIHSITNYVTINDVANILLSFGAAPAMVESFNETYDFASISSGLYLNLGTLTKEQETAGVEAVLGAKAGNTPIVIDPVALGAIGRKAVVLNHLLTLATPAIIKGNGGEILSLAGVSGAIRGVDAVGDQSGLVGAVPEVARKLGVTIAATGEVDVISDGKQLVQIHNGHQLLTKVTGAGCMTGALVAAAAAVEPDPLIAATAGILAMSVAGELAAEKAGLPGSFRVALIDSIYELSTELINQKGRIDVQSV
jgi:hydroxyethylthiazole kinase